METQASCSSTPLAVISNNSSTLVQGLQQLSTLDRNNALPPQKNIFLPHGPISPGKEKAGVITVWPSLPQYQG